MKLPLCLLHQYIDLPIKDESSLRHLFDELGLEVEEILNENGETFFKIETLAHRGDHLYALGIARELSAHFLKPLKQIRSTWEQPPERLSLPVKVLTDKCERYCLLSLDLRETPTLSPFIEQCLGSYDSSKHPLVHLLNYVFMEMGQPMHAFDRDKIQESITVTESTEEETIQALDGKEYRVPPGSILIRDEQKIVAIAGVIGCANSMITPSTRHVLIESATFHPVAIRKTAKKMGLSTDASYAFERGADPEAVDTALKRVVDLISPAPINLAWAFISKPRKPKEIEMSLDLIRKQAAMPQITQEEVIQRLGFLGYTPTALLKEKMTFQVPSWREWNIQTEGAIVEDWIRAYGLNTIPITLPPLDPKTAPQHSNEALLSTIEDTLLGNGFVEVITRSYYSSESLSFLRALDPSIMKGHISIKNAVDKDNAFLKRTNCLHMAQTANTNLRKGVSSVKIYECARLFDQEAQSIYPLERDVLSFAISGRWFDSEWKQPESAEEKLYLTKGVIEELIQRIGFELHTEHSSIPYLHPGCQARLTSQGLNIGFFGLLHPQLKTDMDLLDDVVYGEIDMDTLNQLQALPHPIKPASDFPSIKRDLTFKLPLDTRAGDISTLITSLAPKNLSSSHLRDLFKKPDEPFRRTTYRLLFQSLERTLSHEEVDEAMEKLVVRMRDEHGLEIV